MTQDKYYVELRNKTALPVTTSQAEIIDRAWQNKAIVKIGESRVNTVDIVGIWDADTWYENHPDDKPTAFHDRKILPAATKTSNYDMWIEATARNKKRIQDKERPYAYWRVTTDGELIADPKYYDNVITNSGGN